MDEEAILEGNSTTREAISSFELNSNSKGYTWKIKVYNKDLDQLFKQVSDMNERAKEQYGRE